MLSLSITNRANVDRILAYIVRLVVWLAGFIKPLSRIGLCRYEEYAKGNTLKVLLVGYNGARNTGADARVVALTRQLEEALGAKQTELTVMTLDTDNVDGYFSSSVRLFRFTTLFFFPLLKAASRHHVAVLCEGSTLTRTFADALCVFYCEAAGIMRRQQKPCIAYGSEVGHVDGWLGRLSRDTMRDTYFIVRTEESLRNLKALGLNGHVGTDTAWTFQTSDGEQWARQQLQEAGWDGRQPLLGVAVLNPFCWPVCPSLQRWIKATLTGDRSLQYDKMYFFSDSEQRREHFQHYISEMSSAVNTYQKAHDAFVVVLGMEQLDTKPCQVFEQLVEGPHAMFTSRHCDVFQMTGLLRQLSMLVTSRYHAAVLSMERAIPIVAVSMDNRLNGVMRETELADHYLFSAADNHLGEHITEALQLADRQRQEIADIISRHLADYKKKVGGMSNFFTQWIDSRFS